MPELNRSYSTKEICLGYSDILTRRFIQIPLPTEVVVCEPRHVTPLMARIFRTSFHLYLGNVCLNDEIQVDIINRFGKFEGFFKYGSREVFLAEQWLDEGDDGHTDPYMNGYRFITWPTKEDLEAVPNYRKRTGEDKLLPFIYESGWVFNDVDFD